MDWYYSLCKEQRNEDPLTETYLEMLCLQYLQYFLFCAALSSPPQWRLFIYMEIKPVSLFEVDQCYLPEHSCSQLLFFFFFFKERTLVGCFYSKVKEKQQQGPGGAGFFVLGGGFFDPPGCVTGSCWGQSCLEGLWRAANKPGSVSGHLSECGRGENFGGVLLVFWFGELFF